MSSWPLGRELDRLVVNKNGLSSIELMVWVRARRASKKLSHYSEAPEPLSWPALPSHLKHRDGTVGSRRREGRPYLEWRRPASSQIDPSRRLLATGRYADEEEAAQKEAREALSCHNTEVRSQKAKRKHDSGKTAINGQAKRRRRSRSLESAVTPEESSSLTCISNTGEI